MRLIIDLDEYDYSTIINDERYMPLDISVAIKNSIPFEQITSEIKKEYEDNVGQCGDNDLYTLGLKKALEIIDRHKECDENDKRRSKAQIIGY